MSALLLAALRWGGGLMAPAPQDCYSALRPLDPGNVIGPITLAAFAAHYGTTDPIYDYDRNGSVGVVDLALLASSYGQVIRCPNH
jgi:hypothetical protein